MLGRSEQPRLSRRLDFGLRFPGRNVSRTIPSSSVMSLGSRARPRRLRLLELPARGFCAGRPPVSLASTKPRPAASTIAPRIRGQLRFSVGIAHITYSMKGIRPASRARDLRRAPRETGIERSDLSVGECPPRTLVARERSSSGVVPIPRADTPLAQTPRLVRCLSRGTSAAAPCAAQSAGSVGFRRAAESRASAALSARAPKVATISIEIGSGIEIPATQTSASSPRCSAPSEKDGVGQSFCPTTTRRLRCRVRLCSRDARSIGRR